MTIPHTRPAPGRHRAPDAAPTPAPWVPQQGPRSPHSGGWPAPVPSGPFAAAPVTSGRPRSATSGPVVTPMRVVPPAPRYGHPMPPAPMPRAPMPPASVPPASVLPASTAPAEDDPPTHAFPTPPTGDPTPGGPASQEKPRRKTWPWVVGALAVLVLGATIAESGPTTAPTPTVAAPAASASTDDTGADTATFGQQVAAGDVTVTAQKPQQRTQELIGTQYCSSVTLTNNGSSTEAFAPFDWKFRTSSGVETTAGVPFVADQALTSGTLQPGGTVSGEVCADTGTTGVTDVVYSPGFGILHEVTFAP